MSTKDNVLAAASGTTAPGTMSQASVTDTAIHEALEALDPKNDAHWTADGKPAMDAINALLPAAITRARLDEVAPDFVRPAATTLTSVLNAGIGHAPLDGDGVALTSIEHAHADEAETFEDHVVRRLDALEADNAFLRKTFGWPTKDA